MTIGFRDVRGDNLKGLPALPLWPLFGIALISAGCTYSLPPVSPGGLERLRVISHSPERFTLHFDAIHPVDAPVPANGRVSLTIPAFRQGCAVRFLGIRVSDGYDPRKEWALQVRDHGISVRTMTFHELAKLRADAEGYRLLQID